MTPDGKEPDWQNSHHWDEFEWEKAFKYSEEMTARYFGLLDRYGDMPDAERFINSELADEGILLPPVDDPVVTDAPPWDPDVAEPDDRGAGPEMAADGDAYLAHERHPTFVRCRQIALGWCNVLASVLDRKDQLWGLTILFRLGRILSYLSMAIHEGIRQREYAVALAKRTDKQINDILQALDEKLKDNPEYANMFGLIRKHLLEAHDLTVDFMDELDPNQDPPF
mgnify:CR=1 FL=1